MATIRVFWQFHNTTPETDVKNLLSTDIQLIYRDDDGILLSDSVHWIWDLKQRPASKQFLTNKSVQSVAGFTEIIILKEENIQDQRRYLVDENLNNYNQIVLDDQLTDNENSSIIADSLRLSCDSIVRSQWTWDGGAVIPDFTPGITGRNNQQTWPVFTLPQDILINYSIWCEIHNRLMIFPNYTFLGDAKQLGIFILKPDQTVKARVFPEIARSWASGGWAVVVSRNNTVDIVKSFTKFGCAVKAANRYIKSLTRERSNLNFKFGQNYVLPEENLVLSLHKEKELK